MAFESFLCKPSNEYELFMKLAHEVQANFLRYHGQDYYIHLTDAGDKKSFIDEVQDLAKVENPWHYTYIERDRQACIMFRTDPGAISMLLYGEYDWAVVKITSHSVELLRGPDESILPIDRELSLTAIEKLQAFGYIEGSLQATKGNKAH